MLAELRVENLGVIDDLSLVFGSGMTVITGETGAGKTLIVEAIELLVGGRADASMVRSGAPEVHVEGRFAGAAPTSPANRGDDDVPVEVDIGDDDADGSDVVMGRVIPKDGRSRAYINGRMATATQLGERGASLVDLHGQHAHQSLLSPAVQRDALDRFAGGPALDARTAYQRARQRVASLTEELASLGGDTRARAREIDLLRFQVEEIDAAALAGADEDAALEAEEDVLGDAAAHRDAARAAGELVGEAAVDAVGGAVGALVGRDPFRALEARLRATQGELGDIAHELRAAAEAMTDDPQRLEWVRLRRQSLRQLRRKYGETLADVLAYRAEIGERLRDLEQYDEKAASIDAELDSAREEASAAAARLSDARRMAAPKLGAAVTEHLRQLAMPHASFSVSVEAGEPGAGGADTVTFLLAANPGEAALPLARVASGGELARTMLAARVVLSGAPPTLVFDEVDAGIGGEAGIAVGRKLATIAATHQVLCVTHLAQVAAFADHHIVVSKRAARGRTVAEATLVEGEERVAEISRMLAGVGTSASARDHARELLAQAKESER